MMQLDTYLSQLLTPLVAKGALPKHDSETESFAQTLDDSKSMPKQQIVEIGEGKYRIEQQKMPDVKQEDSYQKIQTQTPTQDSVKNSEKNEQKESPVLQPSMTQFVLHPLLREINTKTVTPTLKAFITQAAAVIKSVPLESGAKQYQFQFKEPPITVVFETQQHAVKITVRSQNIDKDVASELEFHQKELIKQLTDIFKDQSIEFSLKVEPISDQESHKNSKQNQESSDQTIDETEDTEK